jgi:hypothetical protein
MPDAPDPTPTANTPTNTAASATSATASTPAQASSPAPEPTAVQQIALQEVQALVLATSNLVTTVSALVASALGFVAALAWNKAIQDWLPTIHFLNFDDPLAKDFAYAIAVTLFAVVVITALSLLNRRLKGKNLLKELSK